MKRYKAILLACVALLSACGQKPETKTEQTEPEQHEESTNTVSLSDAQMKTADIETGTVEMKNLTTAISVNGTLAVPNQNKALVTSLAGGTLQSLRVQPGDLVRRGQVIGTIANTQVSSIQQQLIAVNAQIKFSEQEAGRQRELVAGNAAPLKNLQKTEAELNGLKAQRDALKRQLSALGINNAANISSTLTIAAPISGTISEITAEIGSEITANAPVAKITNNSELHLDLFVYEKDLPKVAPGQTIHFTLTNNPGKEYDATVYSVGTAFVNETKAVPVHAKVINDKNGLIEGMSVTARISLGNAVYPAVPDDAIVNDGGKDYVFAVAEADEKAEKKKEKAGQTRFVRIQVLRGTSDVGYTEIKPVSKLPAGTKIVTKGAFFLMAKMTNVQED